MIRDEYLRRAEDALDTATNAIQRRPEMDSAAAQASVAIADRWLALWIATQPGRGR